MQFDVFATRARFWIIIILALAWPLAISFLTSAENILLDKQALLGLAALLLFGLWFLKLLLSEKQSQFRWRPLDWAVLVLVVVVGVATLMAQNSVIAFWGGFGIFRISFASLLAAAVLFTGLRHWPLTLSEVTKVMTAGFIGGVLASVLVGLQITGVFLLPFAKMLSYVTVVSTSLPTTALVLVLTTLLGVALLLRYENWTRWLVLVGLLLHVVALLCIDSTAAWIALAAAGLYLFGLFILRKQKGSNLVYIFLVLVVIAVIGVLFSWRGLVATPQEASLSYGRSWQTTTSVLSESPLFGTGPGSFGESFTTHRDQQFMQSSFWNTSFASARMDTMTWAVETGVLGLLAVVAVVAISWFVLYRYVSESAMSGNWLWAAIGGGALVAVVVGGLWTAGNIAVYGFLTLLVGLALSQVVEKNPRGKLLTCPRAAIYVMVVVAVFALVAFGYVSVGSYQVQYWYARAANQSSVNSDTLIWLKKASAKSDYATVDFAYATAVMADIDRQLQNQSDRQVDVTTLQDGLSQALQVVQDDSQRYQKVFSYWKRLGQLYQLAVPLSPDALLLAKQAYTKALDLYADDPAVRFQLGQLLFVEADNAVANQSTVMGEAADQFKQAIRLKADFASAYVWYGKTLIRLNRIDDAIVSLQTASVLLPSDTTVFLELGTAYYNKQLYDEAMAAYTEAQRLNAGSVTALTGLGLVAEAQEHTNDAIGYFQAAVKLDPSNSFAQEKLDVLVK